MSIEGYEKHLSTNLWRVQRASGSRVFSMVCRFTKEVDMNEQSGSSVSNQRLIAVHVYLGKSMGDIDGRNA